MFALLTNLPKGHFFNKSLLDLTEESCPIGKYKDLINPAAPALIPSAGTAPDT